MIPHVVSVCVSWPVTVSRSGFVESCWHREVVIKTAELVGLTFISSPCRAFTVYCHWGWTVYVVCTEPRSSRSSSSSVSLHAVHVNWGKFSPVFIQMLTELRTCQLHWWPFLQVKAAPSRPVGGAAAEVFAERGAPAGQAALSVPQSGSRLLVCPDITGDQPAHHHLGGAEEDRVAGAGPVVKGRIENLREHIRFQQLDEIHFLKGRFYHHV